MKEINNKILLLVCFLFLVLTYTGSSRAESPSDEHKKIACNKCHDSGSRLATTKEQNFLRQCQDCHKGDQIIRGNFHQAAANRCLHCHSFHEPGQITTAVGNVNLPESGTLNQAHCQACHDPRGDLGSLSLAHRTAAGFYHQEADQLSNVSPSEACLRCHDSGSGSAWKAANTGFGERAFNTHASHPYSIVVIPGQGDINNWIAHEIDPRLPLFDRKMECQTCHLLTVGQKDSLIPFETKYGLCKGCHKHFGDDELESLQPQTRLAGR